MLLIGVRPPVDTFTLLRPYPPNAGNAMKHPPTRFAKPSATSSRFADGARPVMPSSGLSLPSPSALAATLDSKKPSSAMRNEVPMASRTCVMCAGMKGQWKVKGEPVLDLTSPRMLSPRRSQRKA